MSERPTPASRGMSLRTGVHKALEDAANELLRQSLSGVTRHSDKSDILTPWKEQARRGREVYTTDGVPDGSIRRGTFNRALNPSASHLNSVEAMRPPKMDKAHGVNAWDSE